MVQTTNNVFDNSLLKYVTPQSLLAWHRVRLANLMAHNGEEWADIYQQYNSGIIFSYVSVVFVQLPNGYMYCIVLVSNPQVGITVHCFCLRHYLYTRLGLSVSLSTQGS